MSLTVAQSILFNVTLHMQLHMSAIKLYQVMTCVLACIRRPWRHEDGTMVRRRQVVGAASCVRAASTTQWASRTFNIDSGSMSILRSSIAANTCLAFHYHCTDDLGC